MLFPFLYNEKNSNLDGNRFGHTADGRPGWKDGADTVHPFMGEPVALNMPTFINPSGGHFYHEIVLTQEQAKYDLLIITAQFSTKIDSVGISGKNGTELISSACGTGWMATCVIRPAAGDSVNFYHGGTGESFAYIYGI